MILRLRDRLVRLLPEGRLLPEAVWERRHRAIVRLCLASAGLLVLVAWLQGGGQPAAVAVLAAVGSSFPSPALRALRVLGVVTAFAAAGLSFLAIQLTDSRGYVDWLKDARIGFYLAVVGFVLIGIGAAIGPRKV